MYRKLLVPLDSSKLAEAVLPYAEELASRLKAEITLLQVLPVSYHVYAALDTTTQVPYTLKEMEPLKKSAQDYLDKTSKRITDKGIATNKKVIISNATADEIVGYVDKERIDLIIMASHGRTGIGRWVMGSVTDKVVRASKQPIVIIRVKDGHPDVREKTLLNKILVPLDGSKGSEIVLPYIEELASKLQAEVTILHVLVPDYVQGETANYKYLEELRKSSRDYIEKVSTRLKEKGLNSKSELREVITDHEAEAIIKYADEIEVDLVAMATHGRSGISRWAFGSVASKVLHEGNTPILMVREGGAGTD